MDNSVRDWQGRIVGFECRTCYEVYPAMWGVTCNKCRAQAVQINNMKALSESIQNKPSLIKKVNDYREAIKDNAINNFDTTQYMYLKACLSNWWE